MTVLADNEARRRILTEFGTSFFVEAAAGTGKTSALVDRIVGLLRTGGSTLDRVVAVTFTEKAAGEMKLRLRSEIEKARARAAPEERDRLERALEHLELARIGTIHAFCGDLLHERPVEAGIDPLFEVASEEAAESLADEAFEGWFQRTLADPPEGIRRILRRRSGMQSPREQLRNAMRSLREHRDFPEPWRREPFDRNGAIDRLVHELAQLGGLAAASSWPDDYLTRNLTEIDRFVEETARIEAVRGRDYDGLEAELRALSRLRTWSWKGAKRTSFGALSRDEVLARRDEVKTDLEAFIAASDADLAPLLHEALQAPIADYEVLKAKAGQLDFLDLLIKARDLIRDEAGVRHELQQRFTHLFVDEFQDTDPLQAEILLLLAAGDPDCTDWRAVRPVPGKLFLVGDPKQSIYRFRRADVAIYEQVKKRVIGASAELLYLTTSFRAPPSIQSFVNGAFAPAMTAGPGRGQAAYVPLQPSRSEIAGQPTIVALPIPTPYGDYGKIVEWRIEESFPDEELIRDQTEAIRVAYVATTRARDLLVVPVCGDQPIDGWLGVLDPMLYPLDNARRRSVSAPRCPMFGDDSVVERGPEGRPPAHGSVRPGLHHPKADGPGVVWWDPAALSLDVEEQDQLRHQRILQTDPDGTVAAASEENYAAWKAGREILPVNVCSDCYIISPRGRG
jgi:ATP-dependent exoDNAse (exonuclease V) beta subunit